MEKYLIIYDNEKVISCNEFTEGVSIVTPHNFMVETLENARMMLRILCIDVENIVE